MGCPNLYIKQNGPNRLEHPYISLYLPNKGIKLKGQE